MMLLECVGRTAAQGALATLSGAWAGGERRETRARLQAAEVAGEDGEFSRRGWPEPRQVLRRVPNATETVRVRRDPGQHRSRQDAAPVRGEDRHGHQQDAQGAVRASFLHGGPHQGRWGVEKEDLPVGEAASWTDILSHHPGALKGLANSPLNTGDKSVPRAMMHATNWML